MALFYRCLLIFPFLLFSRPLHALRPIVHYHDLVAGMGDSGYRDGPFNTALFNHPMGLALGPDGTKLYVADRDNNCIRTIHLDQENRVDTLAGSPKPGHQDGPAAKSLLNKPTALCLTPDGQLWFYDSGDSLLRKLDLATGQVTTPALRVVPSAADSKPATNWGGVWALLYAPSEKVLYFSQPDAGCLRKLDPSTLEVSTVLKGDPQVKRPGALCLYGDKICFADRDLRGAFTLEAASNTFTPALYQTLFRGDPVPNQGFLSLTSYQKALYAVEKGPTALERFFQDFGIPMNLMSVWGPALIQKGGDYGDEHYLEFYDECPGIVLDPAQERRFYMAYPKGNCVLVWKDYYFETFRELHSQSPNHLNDFHYPLKKPPHTFRILLVGDSASFSTGFIPGVTEKGGPYRIENMPKRLELMLNTEAALEDWDENFEVLDTGYGGDGNPLFLWPYYEVPEIVKNFDVDLVIYCVATNSNSNYQVFFQRPLTAEGIPAAKDDPEYLLKPWADRIPHGVAGDFYKRCLEKKWVRVNSRSELEFEFFNTVVGDPDIRRDLMEMEAKPIGMMGDKIAAIRTSGGKPVPVYLFLMLERDFLPGTLQLHRDYWKEMAERCHFTFEDLTPVVAAFQSTYFPLDEWGGHNHLTPEGHYFYAYLMARTLMKLDMLPIHKAGAP